MKKNILLITVLMLTTVFSLWSETGREIMESVIDNQKTDSSAMDMRKPMASML